MLRNFNRRIKANEGKGRGVSNGKGIMEKKKEKNEVREEVLLVIMII